MQKRKSIAGELLVLAGLVLFLARLSTWRAAANLGVKPQDNPMPRYPRDDP